MTIADVIILGVIALSCALAASHGFFYEAFRLAGVLIGYLVAAWEYPRLAAWYAQFVKTEWASKVAAFLTIFLAIVVLAGIVGQLARWGAHEVGLRWFDRALGGIFGVVRGVLLVTVVLVAAGAWAPNAGWLVRSRIAPYLLILGRAAVWAAPGEIRVQFREGLKRLHDWPTPASAPASSK